MLKIDERTMAALSRGDMDAYVGRCLAMLQDNLPDQCAMSDRETVVDQIHAGTESGFMAGFDEEPEAIQFVYLHFLLGSGFATDPRYGWLDRILTRPGASAEARMEDAMDAVAARLDAGSPLEEPLTRNEFDTLSAVARANA